MALPQEEQLQTASDVTGAIRQFVLKQFPLARKNKIDNAGALLEGGVLDSMGVLEVVTFIESEYEISVSDDDLIPDNFQSIDRIAAFVRSRRKT